MSWGRKPSGLSSSNYPWQLAVQRVNCAGGSLFLCDLFSEDEIVNQAPDGP